MHKSIIITIRSLWKWQFPIDLRCGWLGVEWSEPNRNIFSQSATWVNTIRLNIYWSEFIQSIECKQLASIPSAVDHWLHWTLHAHANNPCTHLVQIVIGVRGIRRIFEACKMRDASIWRMPIFHPEQNHCETIFPALQWIGHVEYACIASNNDIPPRLLS